MRRLVLLLPASFIANTGIGMLNFGLIFYMRDMFGVSPRGIGWLSSLWALSYFFGCILLRRISRRFKASHMIAAAALAMGFFVFFILLCKRPLPVYIYYSLFGFLTALYWPPLMGWLSEGFEKNKLNRVLSHFNISWSSGLVLSPYLAGLLLEINIRLPLAAAAVLFSILGIICALFKLFIKKPDKGKPLSSLSVMKTVPDKSTKLRFITWMGVFSAYFIYGIIIFIFPLYARDVLLFSESSIGLLLLFRALFSTAAFALLGKFAWWHFNRVQMIVLQGLLLLFCVLFAVRTEKLFFVFMLSFYGLLFSFNYVNSIFHGVSGSLNRERRMSVHEIFLTAGVFTGAVTGGEIYQRLGFSAVLYLSSSVTAAVLIVQLVFLFRISLINKKKRADPV